MVTYLLKLSLFWLALYLCYALLLRRQTFLRWNRAYLLGALVLGFVLPLVTYPETAPPLPVVYQVVTTDFVVTTAAPSPSLLTWENALWAGYLLGALLMLGRLLRHFRQLFSFIRQSDAIDMDDHTLVLLADEVPGGAAVGSFSFMRWVFISHPDYESNFDTILNHELVHVRQRHSWDIIFLEILQVVFWFNPVLFIYKKALQQIHEYLADEAARANDRDGYAEFLVSYALNGPSVGAPSTVLTNQFFNTKLLKNRIAMLYKNKNSNWSLGKYAAVALFVGCTALFVASCEREITPSAANGEQMVKGNVSVEGIITGPNGKPLQGVTIAETDGRKGTTTNAAGRFELKVAPGSDVKVAYPGFSGFNFKVSPKYAKANFSIKMEPGTEKAGNIAISSFPAADGQMINVTIQSSAINGETIFSVVENQPEFPGGIQEMYKFLARNIKYPTAAAKANVTGKVFLNFVITTEGEIKDIQVLKGIGFGADAEAVRVVQAMPRWKPGMQSGKAVNVRYNLPIAFEIEDGKTKAADKKGDGQPAGVTVVSFAGSDALVVVDGVEKAAGFSAKEMDPNTIQSIDVLKGQKATDKYGDKGKNGVVEIKLKK